jgi:Thioredoxin-like
MNNISYREHRELGHVIWLRDFNAALAEAKNSNKPIMLLFQEVPGCASCVNFGHDVLEHPLLVELIEDRFVPLAIFNNHPGPDAEILAKFNERAWNYPVIYFLDKDGSQLATKLANRYDPVGLLEKLVAALSARRTEIPEYVRLLRDELMVEYGLAKTAVFETPCFWSGETTLAQHRSVLTTEAGWIGGEEVVRVAYDPAAGSLDDLVAYAAREGFRKTDKLGFKTDKAPQYYLSKSDFAFLPLGRAQRTKINLAIPYRDAPERFLSPRQVRWSAQPDLKSRTDAGAYKRDFKTQWASLLDKPLAA